MTVFNKNIRSSSGEIAQNRSFSLLSQSDKIHVLSSKIAIRVDQQRKCVRIYEIVEKDEGIQLKPTITVVDRKGMQLKAYGKPFIEWMFNAPTSIYTDMCLMWYSVDMKREAYVAKRDSAKKY